MKKGNAGSIVWHDSRVQFSAYFPSLTHCSAVLEGVVHFYNGRGTAVMFVTRRGARTNQDPLGGGEEESNPVAARADLEAGFPHLLPHPAPATRRTPNVYLHFTPIFGGS